MRLPCHFHQPATLAAWMSEAWPAVPAGPPAVRKIVDFKLRYGEPSTLRSRLRALPPADDPMGFRKSFKNVIALGLLQGNNAGSNFLR